MNSKKEKNKSKEIYFPKRYWQYCHKPFISCYCFCSCSCIGKTNKGKIFTTEVTSLSKIINPGSWLNFFKFIKVRSIIKTRKTRYKWWFCCKEKKNVTKQKSISSTWMFFLFSPTLSKRRKGFANDLIQASASAISSLQSILSIKDIYQS